MTTEGLSLEFAGNLGHFRGGRPVGRSFSAGRRLTMPRIGIFAALSLCGLALAGCGKTGGFSAEAAPTVTVVAGPELDVGA